MNVEKSTLIGKRLFTKESRFVELLCDLIENEEGYNILMLLWISRNLDDERMLETLINVALEKDYLNAIDKYETAFADAMEAIYSITKGKIGVQKFDRGINPISEKYNRKIIIKEYNKWLEKNIK